MATNVAVQTAIQHMSNFILEYAVTLAALGALTVAIQEAVKKLWSVLGKFHRNALRSWLAPGHGTAVKHYSAMRMPDSDQSGKASGGELRAYAELLHLTTGLTEPRGLATPPPTGFDRHVSNALFELELAQMMGQVQEAADAALNNPTRYPALFAFLTRGCATEDVEQWKDAMASKDVPPNPGASPPDQRDPKKLADLYGRIRLLVRRQLDSFQTVTAYRWREWNQLAAIALGAILMFLAQLPSTVGSGVALLSVPGFEALLATLFSVAGFKMALVSVLGGVLAPVAKDLVDALGKVKTRV
jgi:hypothetical protein